MAFAQLDPYSCPSQALIFVLYLNKAYKWLLSATLHGTITLAEERYCV
jgi:hypothetical protein